ncbi:MAG: hypothetical protein Q7K57_58355 [Burkholderiaceae bacterium]|nr:hypothetical protein [Polaromonas sp.]MDO8778330.1 hypothetical protein [Burkholderiaceae bacterium]
MAAAMAMLRMVGARRLLNYKLALAGKDVRVIPTSTLQKAMKDMGNNLWLGWGYRWEPRHTQRAYEIMKRDLVDVYPPLWWIKWTKLKQNPYKAKGLPKLRTWPAAIDAFASSAYRSDIATSPAVAAAMIARLATTSTSAIPAWRRNEIGDEGR